MQKQIIYGPMPTFDENTQCIVETAPEEGPDYIYIGLEVRDIVADAPKEVDIRPVEQAPPGIAPTLSPEERLAKVETDVVEVREIVGILFGG